MVPSRKLLLASLLAMALAAALAPTAAAGSSRALKLVGGRRARSDSRYSYLARIHFELDGKRGLLAGCGGTLISRRVILTAAHCSVLAKKQNPENVFVRVGAFNPLTDEALREDEFELRRVARIVEHPGYVQLGANEPTSPHDLALLVLDKPVGTRFPTVLLPPATYPYPADNTELHALGWGSTDSENSQPAYTLQDLELPAVSRELCAQQWSYAGAQGGLVGKGHMCAGLRAQANICFGDSGGPLLLRGGQAKEDVQLGVISFSFPTCALPGMPGVFTWLPMYRDWIDTQLRRLDPEGVPKPSTVPMPPKAEPTPAKASAAALAPPQPSLNPAVVPQPAPTTPPPASRAATPPPPRPAPLMTPQQVVPAVPAPAPTAQPVEMAAAPAPAPAVQAVAEQQPAPEQQLVLEQLQDVGVAPMLVPEEAAHQAAAPAAAG